MGLLTPLTRRLGPASIWKAYAAKILAVARLGFV